MLKLTLAIPLTVPLEADSLSPDGLAGLTLSQIRMLPLLLGNRPVRLADCFSIEGEFGDTPELELHGDLSRVKWIGRGMTRGVIRVIGSAGMHLGSGMSGGCITVEGHADDWAGAEMSGGQIHIRGNIGGQAGAAYRGSSSGMSGGTIVIDGTAGDETGMRMRRGTIVVTGAVGDFTGAQMKGGTIVLGSGAGLRTGAWMERGTLISRNAVTRLPTFAYACVYSPAFLGLYARRLAELGFALPFGSGSYQRFAGDSAVAGKGELLVWQPE